MGGILGACNAISDYLHTLNMGSTLSADSCDVSWMSDRY